MISLYKLFEQDEEVDNEEMPAQEAPAEQAPEKKEVPAEEAPQEEPAPAQDVKSGGADAMASLGDRLFQRAVELKQQVAQQAEEEEMAAEEEAQSQKEEEEESAANEAAEKTKSAARIKAKTTELLAQDPEHQKITAADQIMTQISNDNVKKMAEKITPSAPQSAPAEGGGE